MRRRWNRAGEHPALRAFRAIEDAYYRVSARRRAAVVALVRAALGRHLVPDHQVLRDFDAQQHTYGPTSMQNIAAGQGVRYLMPWEWVTHAFRSAWIFEFMVSQWVCLCWPSWSHRWTLVPLALGMTGWRQHWAVQEAQAWVPRYLAPIVGAVPAVAAVAVNRRGVGWWRVGWWQWRPDPVPALTVDLTPLVVGLVLVLALAWPSVTTAGVSLAALSAGTVWEVRTTGNAANAGGFNPAGSSPGTDYSQQDSPQVTIDGATITLTVHTTTTQVNLSGYTVASTDNRNLVRIEGGTMTAGTYEITAVDVPNNRWTLDRSAGTSTQTGTGRMGGAQSDPALVAALVVAANQIWVKSGTYTISSTSANVAGGRINLATTGNFPSPMKWEGYNSSRGDLGTKPVFQVSSSGVTTITVFTCGGDTASMVNMEVDGQAKSSIRGFDVTGTSTRIRLLTGRSCTNIGVRCASQYGGIVQCFATGCTTAYGISVTQSLNIFGCVATSCTAGGLQSSADGHFSFCVASGNTGLGFTHGGLRPTFLNCVAYGQSSHGFDNTGNFARAGANINCIAEGNGGYGWNTDQTPGNLLLAYCAGYNNTSGNYNSAQMTTVVSFVTGSASFFTNAAGGDFSLNNTAGAGASARAAGILGTFPGISTTGYLDIGAAQHADPASSGGFVPYARTTQTGIHFS